MNSHQNLNMFLYLYWLSSYILFSLHTFLTQEVEKDIKVLHNMTGPWFYMINTTQEYKQYCLEVRVTLAGPQSVYPQIAKFMGPTWGPSGADRTQVGPCWPHELCYQGHNEMCTQKILQEVQILSHSDTFFLESKYQLSKYSNFHYKDETLLSF